MTSRAWWMRAAALSRQILRASAGNEWFPRISCAACDFGALHAVPAGRDRTRGHFQCSVQEIRVKLYQRRLQI
jgi:hypothetical protein